MGQRSQQLELEYYYYEDSLPTWKEEKRFADQFNNQIIELLNKHIGKISLQVASVDDDQTLATDFIFKEIRIGCRIRRIDALQYKHQFTIRTHSKDGTSNNSELYKLCTKTRTADYLFYGFGNEITKLLEHWFIGDMRIFRQEMLRQSCFSFGRSIPNFDGTKFLAFDLNDFPPEFIIAKGEL